MKRRITNKLLDIGCGVAGIVLITGFHIAFYVAEALDDGN